MPDCNKPENTGITDKDAWYCECHSIADEYRRILDAVTKFPRAGEHNVLVSDFVEMCVAIWERGGSDESQTEWVIDVSPFQK